MVGKEARVESQSARVESQSARVESQSARVAGRGSSVASAEEDGGFAEEGSRLYRPVLLTLLLAVIVLSVGCSEGEPAPAGASAPEEAIVEEAPAADSIEMVDDERSLERRIEDEAIATQVRIALVDASELRRFEFDPQVVNGRVVLRGEVNTQNQRSRAAEIAKGVKGVRGVTNHVTADEEPVLASEMPDTTAPDTSDQLAQADQDTGDAQGEAPSETDAEQESAAQQQAQQATYHTVKSGESLWTISRNYGVTIAQIRRLNNLTSNNLRPGQRLQVK